MSLDWDALFPVSSASPAEVAQIVTHRDDRQKLYDLKFSYADLMRLETWTPALLDHFSDVGQFQIRLWLSKSGIGTLEESPSHATRVALGKRAALYCAQCAQKPSGFNASPYSLFCSPECRSESKKKPRTSAYVPSPVHPNPIVLPPPPRLAVQSSSPVPQSLPELTSSSASHAPTTSTIQPASAIQPTSALQSTSAIQPASAIQPTSAIQSTSATQSTSVSQSTTSAIQTSTSKESIKHCASKLVVSELKSVISSCRFRLLLDPPSKNSKYASKDEYVNTIANGFDTVEEFHGTLNILGIRPRNGDLKFG